MFYDKMYIRDLTYLTIYCTYFHHKLPGMIHDLDLSISEYEITLRLTFGI